MKYNPELTWIPGDRAVSAVCSHCRWGRDRITMSDIRKHALANRGHAILVTTRVETVVSTDLDIELTVHA